MKLEMLWLRTGTVLLWMASLVLPLSVTSHAGAEALFSSYGIRRGDQRVGVVVLDLDGSPNPSSLSKVHDVLEGADRRPYSVQRYFAEATRGEIRFDFDMLGQFTVDAAWCDHESVAGAGHAVLVWQGVDLYQYDAMIYFTEEVPDGGCRYQGGSYQASYRDDTKTVVLYGNQQPALIVHELGHELGLEHAHKYACRDSHVTYERCFLEEYGDPTDIMGHAMMAKMYYGFNAPHKIAMALIPESEIKGITKPGIYTLIGSEVEREGTHILKIRADDGAFGENAYFLIEYRQPLPEFSKSMARELVVTVGTEGINQPTYYVGSLNCHRTSCDSLVLNQGAQSVIVTALYEGTGKAKVRVETRDSTIDGR